MNVLPIGSNVERISTNYTNGRTGKIIDVDHVKKRYRVRWWKEKSGSPINWPSGFRTWCHFESVKHIDSRIL